MDDKIKHYFCKFCGKKVFWAYQDGKEILFDECKESNEFFVPEKHNCEWLK